jgi:hypothetical protein
MKRKLLHLCGSKFMENVSKKDIDEWFGSEFLIQIDEINKTLDNDENS